jgi:pullulanase/glycogen debranching enzyme
VAELCLFDTDGRPTATHDLPETTVLCRHDHLPGVAHLAVLDHLVVLGVSAVELMPVHRFDLAMALKGDLLAIFLNGRSLPALDPEGRRVGGCSLRLQRHVP